MRGTRKLHGIIEETGKSFVSSLKEDYSVSGVGCTMDEAKESLLKSIRTRIRGAIKQGSGIPSPFNEPYEVLWKTPYDKKKEDKKTNLK